MTSADRPDAADEAKEGARSASALRERVAELERERQLLNAIANFAPSLICLVDVEGRVRPHASNQAFERTLGYEPEETGGALFWERYVADGERAAARDCILTAIRTQSRMEHEGRWLQRDGTPIDVTWTCTPLPRIASGAVFLISGNDITDRKRHEAEVRQSRARIVAAADDARRHAEATRAAIRVRETGDKLVVVVEDDGRGGADPYTGSGLPGLGDRVTALEGSFFVDSPMGAATRIRAELPLS